MSAKTMAEVLAEHQLKMGYRDMKWHCFCGWSAPMADGSFTPHQSDALTAEGFGNVKEAAAAGLYSVDDIWGAGGRATVRLAEIRKAAGSVLAGEWDKHIEWNLKDIQVRKAREAAAKGAS